MRIKKGDKFNETFLVSENIYKGFISIFKDKNPLHTNREFAIERGFRNIVVHGNILNGFLSYFIGERLPFKNVIIHKQEIKYHRPVYINDKLSFYAEVMNIFDELNVIEVKFFFNNQDCLKVASGKFQIGVI